MTPQDEADLRLLTVFHYVVAGLAYLFSLFPIFHLILGLVMVFTPEKLGAHQNNMPPAFFGWFFIGIAGLFILFGLTFSTLVFFAGRCLSRRKRYTFCFVMAAIECMFVPFGTILGVFTIFILNRPAVKEAFQLHPTSRGLETTS
jgi:hypothetical protein